MSSVAAPNTQRQNSRSGSGSSGSHDEPSDGSGNHHGRAHFQRTAKLCLHVCLEWQKGRSKRATSGADWICFE